MFMRGYKKRIAELEAENKQLRRDFNEVCEVCKNLEVELARYRELEAVQLNLDPKPRGIKVPHCTTCPYHVRFNNAGKYAHQCNKEGRQISGNDTRTSPKWCPLRLAKTAASTAENMTEKGSVNHDDSTV